MGARFWHFIGIHTPLEIRLSLNYDFHHFGIFSFLHQFLPWHQIMFVTSALLPRFPCHLPTQHIYVTSVLFPRDFSLPAPILLGVLLFYVFFQCPSQVSSILWHFFPCFRYLSVPSEIQPITSDLCLVSVFTHTTPTYFVVSASPRNFTFVHDFWLPIASFRRISYGFL